MPTDTEVAISDDETSSVIALAARIAKPEAAETTAAARKDAGLVTVRPKPEKRKNFKERAKEKYAKKDTKKDAEDGTTPDMTAKAKSKADKKAEAKKAKKSKLAAHKAA